MPHDRTSSCIACMPGRHRRAGHLHICRESWPDQCPRRRLRSLPRSAADPRQHPKNRLLTRSTAPRTFRCTQANQCRDKRGRKTDPVYPTKHTAGFQRSGRVKNCTFRDNADKPSLTGGSMLMWMMKPLAALAHLFTLPCAVSRFNQRRATQNSHTKPRRSKEAQWCGLAPTDHDVGQLVVKEYEWFGTDRCKLSGKLVGPWLAAFGARSVSTRCWSCYWYSSVTLKEERPNNSQSLS